jgi:formate hydrogenlyase transcriptional activator
MLATGVGAVGTSIAAEPLLSIAVGVTSEQRVEAVLQRIVEGLASQPGVALVRIWLLRSIHIPNSCQDPSDSPEDIEHLRLMASAGTPINSPGEDWSFLHGHFARMPLSCGKVGQVAADRHSILIKDFAPQDNWIIRPEWAEREGIRSFAGYPLLFQDKLLGVIGIFSRRPLLEQEFTWLGIFANHAAVGIANARAFEGRKLAEEALRRSADTLQRSEFYLAEGQRLGHAGSWAFNTGGCFEYWSQELFQIYGLDPQKGAPTLEQYLATIHPQDRLFMAETIKRMQEQRSACDVKKRIIRPDGALRYVRCVGIPVLDNGVLKGFLGTTIDVTEQEQLTQELLRREAYLAEAQGLSHTGSFGWNPDSGEIVWSDETHRIFEYDRSLKPTLDSIVQRVHPEDRAGFQKVIDRAFEGATHFEHTYRLLLPDGRIKHVHALAHAVQDPSGNREFVGAGIDVTGYQNAEDKIREQEMELRQMLDLAPQQVAVFGPNREHVYANRILLEYMGLTLEEWQRSSDGCEYLHPEDRERFKGFFNRALFGGFADDLEFRLCRADGSYRWFLYRFNPLRDEQGQIKRWYVASTDIEERKQTEERLRRENVALREEVSKASMFDEIVGASPALQTVLSRISKVATVASTVLITGETGTGKELIARAVHRRSQRCSRPFVSVNCAAVPKDLIASELFGHEKGAFTGALHRRLGRFELAEGGTIFLDEIGELPAEMQIALLRVLQEHEFERVGGNQPIRIDVRVVAASNRDLLAAIAAGTFRSDLFYRINVFPIEVPPLRERKEDIEMLVAYFIDRFARMAGKKIKTIDKKTLELIKRYPWPGNIRELQNVVERSVVLCETEIFSVDQSWLSRATSPAQAASPTLWKKPVLQEKEFIEAALAETKGRVSGPAGAAAKLGIPSTTLESKIKSLKINKYYFKAS